jgi:very-short-patch-repair endonuclease
MSKAIGPINRIRLIDPPVRRDRFTKVGDIPANVRTVQLEPWDMKEVEVDDRIIGERRGLYHRLNLYEELEKRAAPESETGRGSVQERILYKELRKMNVPFDFQSSMMGARPGGSALGGLVADFVLLDRPLVIQVQGDVWHSGVEAEVRDIEQADELNRRGFDVVFLWDHVIHKDHMLREFLNENVRHYFPRGLLEDMGVRSYGGIRVERPRAS